MMLHDDIELFEQVIVRTSEELNVELPIVERTLKKRYSKTNSPKRKLRAVLFMLR